MVAPLVRASATVTSAAGVIMAPLASKTMFVLAAPPKVTPVPAVVGIEPVTAQVRAAACRVKVSVMGTALPSES